MPEKRTADPTPTASSARPTYAGAFRCIGPACEDDCCHDWSIPVDKQTYQRYAQFPPGKLGAVVAQFVSITPHAPDPSYAEIHQSPAGCCAFLGPDRLCGIHKEYGAGLLSATCSIYPRALNRVDGQLEGSLYLSCPEAARNVLLVPDALDQSRELESGDFRTDNASHLSAHQVDGIYKPYSAFHQVRALLLAMVRDRKRPLWQRLLLIGAFCEHLNQVARPEQEQGIPVMLADYKRIVTNGELTTELDALPSAPCLQLDVILKLTAQRVRDGARYVRFSETFQRFADGIGYGADATSQERTQRYLEAEQHYHRAFFASRPHVLENYLGNDMLQRLFPFGRAGSEHYQAQSIMDEYVLMATRFAWLNGLLIGVAGHYRERFSEEHVVATVQSFCRAIEHHPSVLVWINDTMRSLKLNHLNGMAVMLRP